MDQYKCPLQLLSKYNSRGELKRPQPGSAAYSDPLRSYIKHRNMSGAARTHTQQPPSNTTSSSTSFLPAPGPQTAQFSGPPNSTSAESTCTASPSASSGHLPNKAQSEFGNQLVSDIMNESSSPSVCSVTNKPVKRSSNCKKDVLVGMLVHNDSNALSYVADRLLTLKEQEKLLLYVHLHKPGNYLRKCKRKSQHPDKDKLFVHFCEYESNINFYLFN